MLSVIRADGTAERQALRLLRSRSGEVDREVTAVVTQIIETVRQKGDAALKQYAQQFDGVVPAQMEGTGKYRRLSCAAKTAELFGRTAQRGHSGSAGTRSASRGALCSRRHCGLPLFRSDERGTCQNRRRWRAHHGHPAG